MKKLILFSFTGMILGCNSHNDEAQNDILQPEDLLEIVEVIDVDSLLFLKDSIDLELIELKEKFSFLQEDLEEYSYYHESWYDRYYMAGQALLAGVDSIGNFFLISNVWTGPKHDSITLAINDSTYKVTRQIEFDSGSSVGMEVMCAGCIFDSNFYMGESADNAGKLISENVNSNIKLTYLGGTWKRSIYVNKKDKNAIKDCYNLSLLIKELNLIDEQLDEADLGLN